MPDETLPLPKLCWDSHTLHGPCLWGITDVTAHMRVQLATLTIALSLHTSTVLCHIIYNFYSSGESVAAEHEHDQTHRLVPNFTSFEVTTGLVHWSQIKIRYIRVLVICHRQHVDIILYILYIMEPNFIPIRKNLADSYWWSRLLQ